MLPRLVCTAHPDRREGTLLARKLNGPWGQASTLTPRCWAGDTGGSAACPGPLAVPDSYASRTSSSSNGVLLQ